MSSVPLVYSKFAWNLVRNRIMPAFARSMVATEKRILPLSNIFYMIITKF